MNTKQKPAQANMSKSNTKAFTLNFSGFIFSSDLNELRLEQNSLKRDRSIISQAQRVGIFTTETEKGRTVLRDIARTKKISVTTLLSRLGASSPFTYKVGEAIKVKFMHEYREVQTTADFQVSPEKFEQYTAWMN